MNQSQIQIHAIIIMHSYLLKKSMTIAGEGADAALRKAD